MRDCLSFAYSHTGLPTLSVSHSGTGIGEGVVPSKGGSTALQGHFPIRGTPSKVLRDSSRGVGHLDDQLPRFNFGPFSFVATTVTYVCGSYPKGPCLQI